MVLVGRMNSANALIAEGIELQTIAAVVIGEGLIFWRKETVFGTLVGAILMGFSQWFKFVERATFLAESDKWLIDHRGSSIRSVEETVDGDIVICCFFRRSLKHS